VSAQKLAKAERQERILSELHASATIRVSSLAATLGVSGETIRRDLAEMGEGGALARTYGGAVARPAGVEAAWIDRFREMAEERRRIAVAAAEFLQRGDVVMIDAGSTVLHFARHIAAERKDLTVITNSFSVAIALGGSPGVSVVSCPGAYDPHEGSLTGPDTIAFLERFNAGWAVIGASGLAVDGPSEASRGGAAVKRAMLSRARKSMLLIDHSKFDALGLEVICPLTRIGRLVTSAAPLGPLAKALRKAGTEVIVTAN
jgi:DeoR/GlpR family transcriptional regulator of sugar metabolism